MDACNAPSSRKPLGPNQRAYQAYEGQTCFMFCGRLQTSKDSPWIIILSMTLFLAGPALWLVWQVKFLWLQVSPAIIIIGAFFWMNALAAMLYVNELTQCGIVS